MDVYRSQFRDDRLCWIGRGGGSIVLTGAAIGSNLGRVFRDGAEDVDVARGMWCRRSDRRYLLGAYRRVGVRD